MYQLKADYPDLDIIINGGITSVDECRDHLAQVDGVMIGRQAYQQPWFLTELETAFGGGPPEFSREDIILRMLPYVRDELAKGALLRHITRHLLGLFAGPAGRPVVAPLT